MHVVTKATQQVPVKVCPHDCKVPVMKIFPSFKVFFNDVGNLHSHLVSHFITLAKQVSNQLRDTYLSLFFLNVL